MSGSESDVFCISPNYFSNYVEKNLLASLDEYIENDPEFSKESLYEKALLEGEYDEIQYALSREISPTLMFINTATGSLSLR